MTKITRRKASKELTMIIKRNYERATKSKTKEMRSIYNDIAMLAKCIRRIEQTNSPKVEMRFVPPPPEKPMDEQQEDVVKV